MKPRASGQAPAFTAGEFHLRPNNSLAIPHGLEDLYQEPEKPVKKKRGKK